MVAVRFKVRGCNGESGVDKDLRSVPLPVFLGVGATSVLMGVCGGGEVFAASFKAFRAALITCVASTSLSFADSPPFLLLVWDSGFAASVFARALELAGTRFVACFVEVPVTVEAEAASGMRSSRNMTVVADVQVFVDDTAALTVSILLLMEVIVELLGGH